MKKLLIIGAGDFAKQMAYWVTSDAQFDVVGFVDDYKKNGEIVDGYPVLGKVEDVVTLYESEVFEEAIIAIGYNHLEYKYNLYNALKDKIPFATFIHSSCIVDRTSIIEPGCFIYPGCVIDMNVTIKHNTTINLSSTIGHDSIVEPCVFIAAKVLIGGCSIIGKQSMIGNGVITKDHISIIPEAHISAGSVILKNIRKKGIYLGNPASFFAPLDY